MPRKSRIDAPGAFHHIICRGIEKKRIFKNNADMDNFVDRLGTIIQETSTSCYAWALIPNHFHLLLRTGTTPIATVMGRLLTGYALSFNHRHRRHGHLFQNRYKSILCQEGPYLKELVRYIHLNPLRAGLVSGIKELSRSPYCGHSRLTGNILDSWQDVEKILSLFGPEKKIARQKYNAFVQEGISAGRKPQLTRGDLVRGAEGWRELKSLQQMKIHGKCDERILGDKDFVEKVLSQANEAMERKYRLTAEGYTFESIAKRVSKIYKLPVPMLLSPGKQPHRVKARSVLAYWSVRELGITGVRVGKQLGLSQSAVSKAVQRGEQIVSALQLSMQDKQGKE